MLANHIQKALKQKGRQFSTAVYLWANASKGMGKTGS